jgi:hypothetical protein
MAAVSCFDSNAELAGKVAALGAPNKEWDLDNLLCFNLIPCPIQ